MGGSRAKGFTITRTRRSRWQGSSEIAEVRSQIAKVTAHERQALPLVHFAAVADFKDEDHQYLLLEKTENAVIADTILPKVVKLSLEALADAARIVQFGHAPKQEFQDSGCDGGIELIEFSLGERCRTQSPRP